MEQTKLIDFEAGIAIDKIADGMILEGRVGNKEVILVRRGAEFFAAGAACTHYHASLAKGLIVDDTIRCPMHHACFSLRTGEALRAPALDPIAIRRVELRQDKVFVCERLAPPKPRPMQSVWSSSGPPSSVVIVGGGAAGLAAADALRRRGYSGAVTIVSADDTAPYDRPNLSKDFLVGNAPAAWMPLRTERYYSDRQIDLLLDARVASIDASKRIVRLADGRQIAYGALLLATGADPVKLPIPTAAAAKVFYLRSFADGRAIAAQAAAAKNAVVVGAGFIGLEVAASLRMRKISVHVVAPDRVPLGRILGTEVGTFVRGLHEAAGVRFHLGRSVIGIDDRRVTLDDGTTIEADMTVLGVGVRPAIALAEQAGLAVDRGISVNEYLQTSASGIYAAGDVARWPDPHSGDRLRVEHWVVAQRQGEVAAGNILGAREPFTTVPFFWSQHYDVVINYIGHAESFDSATIDGDLDARDCAVTYRRGDRRLAVATISRDLENLRVEREMELFDHERPA
ncbi:MAG: FAD-dependent oxidoreductase [Steroidobacteraceae bacterium]|jgi:NADPH-dependent 2,4-dienoyl-CoA reductase/sulfur reductase-like enzyme/nitrite reductase/ring-hydroxylating ferredoxin subunit